MGLLGKKWNGEVKSPVTGKTYDLKKINDGVFSKGLMGEGVVIKPTSNLVCSPIDGKLLVAFSTGHAFAITNKNGASILVHIGIDTVNLKGKGFKSKVKQGQKIKAGDVLAEVDFNFIAKKVPSSDVIVVVTPESSKKIKKIYENKEVTTNDSIMDLK